jgi:AraC-like DNA-binding protein
VNSHLDKIANWVVLAGQAHYRAHELAELNDVSLRHLERYFSELFGRAPQDWLDELRLVQAAVFLAQGMAIKEVAWNLQFSDVAHFSRRFKRYHGCSPSTFVRIYYRRRSERRKQFEAWFPGEEVPLQWLADPTLSRPWTVLLQRPQHRFDIAV